MKRNKMITKIHRHVYTDVKQSQKTQNDNRDIQQQKGTKILQKDVKCLNTNKNSHKATKYS